MVVGSRAEAWVLVEIGLMRVVGVGVGGYTTYCLSIYHGNPRLARRLLRESGGRVTLRIKGCTVLGLACAVNSLSRFSTIEFKTGSEFSIRTARCVSASSQKGHWPCNGLFTTRLDWWVRCGCVVGALCHAREASNACTTCTVHKQ